MVEARKEEEKNQKLKKFSFFAQLWIVACASAEAPAASGLWLVAFGFQRRNPSTLALIRQPEKNPDLES